MFFPKPNMMRPRNQTSLRFLYGGVTALLALIIALTFAFPARSKDAPPSVSPADAEFFETKVRPLLVENCISCHGKDLQQAGLRVDSREALLKGGESGTSLVPGDAEKSLLITVVRQTGMIKMPKGGRLKDTEIADLVTWVKMGAPWPQTKPGAMVASANGEYTLTPAQRNFWSLQPVHKPAVPVVKNKTWCQSDIDRFVMAKLEAKHIAPNPIADRRTLLRRVTFDLIGLPPTEAEVTAFVQDKKPGAFARVVDRLLASPRYGERWARHWLDVARYADTKGYVFNEDRNYPYAYTYRDWVIHAFNSDLPYDQFIIQQLAADRLSLGADKRSLAALGFLTVGRRFLNQQPDIIDDRIDVTMRGLQGFTVACARCHDHKFDPIPTKDYYALYGIFASCTEASPPISPATISEPYSKYEQQMQAANREKDSIIREETRALRDALKKGAILTEPVKAALQKVRETDQPGGNELAAIETGYPQPARERLVALRATLDTLNKNKPPMPELAMAVQDNTTPDNPHVFKRGNPNNPGDAVPRRFLLALSPQNTPRTEWKDSGRLELAQAIASKQNPLTARVFVNRVWLQHFGAGLVRTPSDFGKQGERPTHPELLDYLASRFMENGWSIKKLHRMILLSSVYQQSSDLDNKRFAADPENRLLWRMNRRRLDLEAMRDSLLAVSGRLDTRKVGGTSVELWQAQKDGYPTRRTVYGRIERQNLPGTFRTFDFASPDSTNAQRFRTTVPQQALFMMNSPFTIEQARSLIARPDVQAQRNDLARVRQLFRLLYNRAPDTDELALGLGYLKAVAKYPNVPVDAPIWQYGYGAYDLQAQRIRSFTPFTRFVENRYQAVDKLEDPNFPYCMLSATGGHPGRDQEHAVIRRWIAPADYVVTAGGVLHHRQQSGDGVRARIVSSRDGLHGEWRAHNSEVTTDAPAISVKKGDTIDFIVDCVGDQNSDSFEWWPVLHLVPANKTWNSRSEFAGPAAPVKPLNAWERYAQALLMTNEFVFVD